MNRTILINIARFLGFGLAQVLVLKRITLWWDGFHYFQIFLYPLFVLLLPLRTPQQLVLFLAFVMGLSVDMFYDSAGLHASASVFMAAWRPFVLRQLEPRGGYNINFSPTKERMKMPWFLRYTSILIAIHLFFYFCVETFTFVYIGEILLKTICSFAISVFFVLMTMLILNPED